MKTKLKEMVLGAWCLVPGAKKILAAALCAVGLFGAVNAAAANIEVIDGPYVVPQPGGSPLAYIGFKVTSDVGKTNLVFDVAVYSKDRVPYFTDGDISLDFGDTYTKDVLKEYGTAGTTQDVTLAWNWKRSNPDLVDWDGVTVTVAAKLQGEDVAVKCQNGSFVGVRDSVSGVVAFKSVPYAQPPTKETGLRWKPPVKPEDSDAVIPARHFGPAAAQVRSSGEIASYGPVSEDCLKLSIWTADGFTAESKRPVMFYIHGGSYASGGMCDPNYDGDRLIKDNPGVILVSCDYRVNAFGFLDLTGLPGYDPEKHKAYDQAVNLGILDLQAGLRWVKENIEKFGGDPEKVTIFGESAGGGSVSCLLQAKGSEGLFQRAIVMSGALDLTDSPEIYEAGNQAYCMMKAAGKSTIDELLACSTEDLIAALNTSLSDSRLATVRHRTPREGGDLVADLNNYPMCDDVRGIVASDPYEACRTNTVARNVDVMIGTTSEEMNYWATLMYGNPSKEEDPLGYYYHSFLSNKVERIKALYAQVGNTTSIPEFLAGPGSIHLFDSDARFNLGGRYPKIWGRTELMSELSFRMPAIVMAERHGELVKKTGGTGKTYMYYFCRPRKSLEMPWMGAGHASELTSVFKTLHLELDGDMEARKTLADGMSGAFVAFAMTGNPGENWAEYETTERQTTVFGTKGDFNDAELHLVSDPDGDQRKLLQPDYLAYREAKLRTGDAPVYGHDLRTVKPYLYEIWYDNYEDSDLLGLDGPFGDEPVEGLGGCSSVRVGNFHGRNLDIGISDTASIVVHMKAGEGRFASVGTTQWSDVSETALKAGAVGTHRFDVLPSWMLDGINENGVAINVNVVPVDVPQLREGPDDRPSLHARKVVRYVLDHAESAAGVIEDLKKFRIHGNIGTGTYYLHWMISDAKQTFVVEIINGEVVAREHPIMTNFNLNWDNKNQRAIQPEEFADWGPDKYFNPAIYSSDTSKILEVYTPHGDGIERYLTLRDAPYTTMGATFEGMFELMRLARYSRVADLPLDQTFRSDLAEIAEVKKAGLDDIARVYAAENFDKLQEVWKTLQPAMTNAYAHLAEHRKPGELGEYSITTHNVTFDLAQRIFRIVVQEEYNDPFNFWLVEPARVTLPAGVQGYSYVVSNLTAGAEAEILPVASVAGGASYELPFGAKVAIYAVPTAGYAITGTNPYVIEKVTMETTIDAGKLPTAVEVVDADTVVYGTIRTADEGNPVAGAIAIKDGKYVYVGNADGAAAFVKEGVTEVIDHRGKGMVMPGCTDGHSHYTAKFTLANMKGGVLFSPDDDKTNVLKKVDAAALAAKDAGKTCLFGFGWDYSKLRIEAKLTLTELDNATPGVSAVILDSSGHYAYCNSECLKRCGIIDGKGGVIITEIAGGLLELDANNYPTGYVDERVVGYLTRMGGINADELVDAGVARVAVRASQKLLLSTGYTVALDGWSNQLHPSKFYEAANRMDLGDELTLVYPMTYEVEPWQSDADITEEIYHLGWLNRKYGTSHVLPKYLKLFMDGVVEAKTGAMLKPYVDDQKKYPSYWSMDRLTDITRDSNQKGLVVHVHAMGDSAVRTVIGAHINAAEILGAQTQRNCLVHLRNVSTNAYNDFLRIAENNIACTAGFTWHIANKDDKKMEDYLDKDYIYHAYPMKSFFDAGVKVSSHTDYPANGVSPQDPFGIIEVAVTGQLPTGDRLAPHDTNELITVEQAFQALTLNGAWQLGLENERGSIAIGKWADFVLADQDVFTCATTDIHKTKVVSTWFEGKLAYPLEPGSKKNPWNIGDCVEAYTNGTELVIQGSGTIADLSEIPDEVKGGLEKLTVTEATVAGAEANAFAGINGVTLTLPDGWQGELPKDGNWYGAKGVTLTGGYPLAVKNVTFQQRYPWNGLVDIGFGVTGPEGETNVVITVKDGETAVTNFTAAVTIPADGVLATNLVWDATTAGLAANFKSEAVTVEVKLAAPSLGVQLWANGPYWAEANLGESEVAEHPEYGALYKFNDAEKAVADALGEEWRLPTLAEVKNLTGSEYCTKAWNSTKQGYTFTGATEGYKDKSIFLPAAGYGDSGRDKQVGSRGYYWTSTASDDSKAYYLLFLKDTTQQNQLEYSKYMSVRAVRDTPPSAISAKSAAGALDLTVGDRVAKDVETLVVDPAWGHASEATVKLQNGWQRTYTCASNDLWDTTTLTPGRHGLAFYASADAFYKAIFWKLGEGWEILDSSNITAGATFEADKTYLVLGTNTVNGTLTVTDGAKFEYGSGAGFLGGTVADLPNRYEQKTVGGDLYQIVEKIKGCEDNPWDVGDSVTAYTNGTELVIQGAGTITNLAEVAKDGLTAITITEATVTGAASDAFAGLDGVALTLPDGWQGELPDEDGNWYGATGVTLTAFPLTVKNVTFQQRYPWNGLVDISCDLSGAGEVTLKVAALTNGVEFVEAMTLIGETTVDLEAAGGATNGVKFIWNAAADLPAGFKASGVTIKVAVEK